MYKNRSVDVRLNPAYKTRVEYEDILREAAEELAEWDRWRTIKRSKKTKH